MKKTPHLDELQRWIQGAGHVMNRQIDRYRQIDRQIDRHRQIDIDR